jgi:penicillin-binding protein 1A
MSPWKHISLHVPGGKLIGRVAFAFLLLLSIGFGVAAGLIFVYQSDLPEVRELENYRPNVVTELYADDGQVVGTFALQRRILVTYEQIPSALRDAVIVTEDQHFFEHWGVDLPRVLQAAWRNIRQMRKAEGASTLTMQLAGTLFLDRTDRSFRRKIQEALLAMQIERYYSKEQIFTLYANQIYLAHGNYGFESAAQYYFGKSLGALTVPEAALLAGLAKGPSYSPLLNPKGAIARRNLVLKRMEEEGKLDATPYREAVVQPLALNVQAPRNDLAPYFIEEIRKYLERTYGTEAVHERGLRVYTTLNVAMQRAANQAVRDGLHTYERRHGWRGGLTNILQNGQTIETYEHPDWRRPIEKGAYVTGLVTAVDDRSATIKLGRYRALLTPADFAWTGRRSPKQLLKVGDLAVFRVEELSTTVAQVELEQKPQAEAALLAIENPSGEVKAMVGGYSFEESKFNRATQAVRQVGSSFKPYVYATAVEQGYTPFDTILDAPFTTISGGQEYSPNNYDEKFEGRITLRRALAGSRNVPAVKLAEKIGIDSVVDMARRFGITSPVPPYLPAALGAADMTLVEHVSAFTVFPNDGIRIEPHLIRRVASYDGSVLEEVRPRVSDVIAPETARTMVAMLRDAVEFGTGMRAKELGRPVCGKTGTTNDFADAWFLGFTPSMTTGVWIGYDDKRISLGKKETGSRAALPVWLQFMKAAYEGKPPEEFANVEPLAKLALTKSVQVDTPDTAPTEEEEPAPGQAPTPPPPKPPVAPSGKSSPTAH